MSDKTTEPKMVRVEMDDTTMGRLYELMPAMTAWAKDNGAPPPGPGDVIALALALMHSQVFARANEMIEGGAIPPELKH
ncbi:MAG: hypothetical protein OXI20_05440 [Rhodospirillales bacterium]|nr:hypothetical protein [Rhodospirillales bacterium]